MSDAERPHFSLAWNSFIKSVRIAFLARMDQRNVSNLTAAFSTFAINITDRVANREIIANINAQWQRLYDAEITRPVALSLFEEVAAYPKLVANSPNVPRGATSQRRTGVWANALRIAKIIIDSVLDLLELNEVGKGLLKAWSQAVEIFTP